MMNASDPAIRRAIKSGVQVSERIIRLPFNEGLVTQVVTAYMALAVLARKAKKTVAEVRWRRYQPWKQKGHAGLVQDLLRSPIMERWR